MCICLCVYLCVSVSVYMCQLEDILQKWALSLHHVGCGTGTPHVWQVHNAGSLYLLRYFTGPTFLNLFYIISIFPGCELLSHSVDLDFSFLCLFNKYMSEASVDMGALLPQH